MINPLRGGGAEAPGLLLIVEQRGDIGSNQERESRFAEKQITENVVFLYLEGVEGFGRVACAASGSAGRVAVVASAFGGAQCTRTDLGCGRVETRFRLCTNSAGTSRA